MTVPTRPKRSVMLVTQGMRRPMVKVMEPHSMSATDTPRSMDVVTTGDIDTR